MFMSQRRGASRKPFQKPNILRRTPKVIKPARSNECPDTSFELGTSNHNRLTEPTCVESIESDYSHTLQQFFQVPKLSLVPIRETCDSDTSHRVEINGDSITIYASSETTEPVQNTVNVESFLNDGGVKQTDVILLDESLTAIVKDEEPKWTLSLMNENSKDNVIYYNGSQSSSTYCENSSSVITNNAKVSNSNLSQETANEPSQKAGVDYVKSSGAVKLKCDEPNCEKSFWTEARLQGHKNKHKNQKSTPTVLQCPVKRTGSDGSEDPCGRTFSNRSQLLKHLNNEHSPDEALYSCEKCGRRFFYAAGFRSHALTACTRAFLCGWAGCGRVFRQPCRLREHARAHTGDRPYACTYPECNWAFRSASKLMRHMRGHTGERRHECSACGRAFPRREHLRDHFSRHHTQNKVTCLVNNPHDADAMQEVITIGSEDPYITKSLNYLEQHLISPKETKTKNGGKKSAKRGPKNNRTKNVSLLNSSKQMQNEKFVIDDRSRNIKQEELQNSIERSVELPESDGHSVVIESDGHSVVIESDGQHVAVQDDGHSVAIAEEGERCARTHCTWPLQRPQDYAIEDDTQVEQSESSESNIYSVRSDLFLHGNMLINEDSELSMRGAEAESASRESALPDLGLIDSHPTIDLMQEELMYADAVDESSFRVLLLNGEELS